MPRSPSPRPTPRQAPRDQAAIVYGGLRTLIVSGQLLPGTRLVEKHIAARFEVSRTPVRTALDRLEQEGFVVTSPGLKHSLSQVAPLTRDDAIELLETIAAVEGVAGRRAAALPAPARRRLTARLARVNRRLQAASRKHEPDHNVLHQLDAEFHGLFTDAGAGPRLGGLLRSLRPQATRYDQLYVVLLAHRMQPSIREHDAIIKAIGRGDPDRAQRAVEANQRNAGQRLAEAIVDRGERGSW
ncbi:MAG: GntR family transcriptional regulator [Gemmatimonadota bacterium]